MQRSQKRILKKGGYKCEEGELEVGWKRHGGSESSVYKYIFGFCDASGQRLHGAYQDAESKSKSCNGGHLGELERGYGVGKSKMNCKEYRNEILEIDIELEHHII